MKKKYWIIPGIITVAMVASLFALSNPKSVGTNSKSTCCKKTIRECPLKSQQPVSPEQGSLDNLSNQFISIPTL
jgi:hypothetical protein